MVGLLHRVRAPQGLIINAREPSPPQHSLGPDCRVEAIPLPPPYTRLGGAGAPTAAAMAAIWKVRSLCLCRRYAVPLESRCGRPGVPLRSSTATTLQAGHHIHRRLPSVQ